MPADLVPLSFYVLNIKLQTNKSKIDRDREYYLLFKKLAEQRIHERVSADRHMMIFDANEGSNSKGLNYLRGTIGKGIYFDKPGTRVHLLSNTTESQFRDNENILQWTATHYVFIPDAHRLCILKKSKITIKDVKVFLQRALARIIDEDDKIIVEIENSEDILNEIYSADKIKRLSYRVTYTNEDFLKSMGEELDETLRNAGIGEIAVDAKADHNGELKIENEKILQGGIELAKDNGIVSARIVKNGKIKWVTTKKTPLLVEYKTNADSIYSSIVNYIIEKFRPSRDDEATI
ncbi:DUF4747 family protein [Pseudochryseolinea flava]|uniref:DUF4747 domain-containing protein n=1 Tax=Pseudochryseolinea flava TaxID=2059302 RepID=A0A364Y4J7_9BACT|nr:DUF4747 family protein [Pseudochryseolinea flava]RAW01088.1 hypothetical protein DQQ10_12735 [Pseudochryseolinea flava]